MEILKFIIRMKIYRIKNKFTTFLIKNNLVTKKYGKKLFQSDLRDFLYIIAESKKYNI